MAYTQKDWQLSSYTDATDTDFIVDAGSESGTLIKSLLISNTTVGSIDVMVKITDSLNNELSRILPLSTITGNLTSKLDVPLLSLTNGDKIRVYATATGIHFSASGGEE